MSKLDKKLSKAIKYLLLLFFISIQFVDEANSFGHDKLKDVIKKNKERIKDNYTISKPKIKKSQKSPSSFANCTKNTEIIFYEQTDKYLSAIGPQKFKSSKSKIENFSFVLQNEDKDYLVEYIFYKNGTVTARNLKNCKEKKYEWIFKSENGGLTMYLGDNNKKELEMSIGLANSNYYAKQVRFHKRGLYENCYNYMNPQCNQLITESKLVGFRDLKNNKTYDQLKKDYQKKVAEIKKKKEEERLAAKKKREAEIKAEKERQAALAKNREEERKREEEIRKKRIEYLNSPEGILEESYKSYILIKEFYEVRKDYALKYVNSKQMSDAKKQIKAVERTMTKKGNLSNDKVWDKASKWYKEKWASTMNLYKSTASYNQQAVGIVNIYLMSLSSTYNEHVQGRALAPKKDF